MFLFMVCMNITVASKMYVYTAEISVGMSLAFGNFIRYIFHILITVFTQPLFDSSLGPQGAFWLFGGLTILGGIHHFFLLKEINGLTYERKQSLYSNKKRHHFFNWGNSCKCFRPRSQSEVRLEERDLKLKVVDGPLEFPETERNFKAPPEELLDSPKAF